MDRLNQSREALTGLRRPESMELELNGKKLEGDAYTFKE